MKKRWLQVTMLLAVVLLINGCGTTDKEKQNNQDTTQLEVTKGADIENSSQEEVSIKDPSEDKEPIDIIENTLDVDLQIKLIADNSEVWYKENLYGENYYYTITDLDHNGRLEVISASLAGTGLYTWADYYEMNESGDNLVKCMYEFGEGESQPDIMKDIAECYYNADSDVYYYIMEDVLRISIGEQLITKSAVSLQDGEIIVEPLVFTSLQGTEDGLVTTYTDKEGNIIDEKAYNDISYLYQDCELSEVQFGWIELANTEGLLQILVESYSKFAMD